MVKLAKFTGSGMSPDGSHVTIEITTLDGDEITVPIKVGAGVSAVIAQLILCSEKASTLAEQRSGEAAETNDPGFWLHPKRIALLAGKDPSDVLVEVDIPPTRLKFRLTTELARQLGRDLLTLGAPSGSRN